MCHSQFIRTGFKWPSADRHNLSPLSTLICCHLHLLLLRWHTSLFNYNGLIGFLLQSLQTRGHPILLLADNYLEGKKKILRRKDTLSYSCIGLLINGAIIHEEVCVLKDFNTWHGGKEAPDVTHPLWRIWTNPLMQTSEWIIRFTTQPLAEDFHTLFFCVLDSGLKGQEEKAAGSHTVC